jgi:spermidine synthase
MPSIPGRVRLTPLLVAWLLTLACHAVAAERVILEQTSPYNTVYVSENQDGMRILRFERYGARQSVVKLGHPEHLELPYARVIPLAFAFVDRPKSALVIGLGGGTIPSFLRKSYPDMKIDAVDIDPVVVEVAKSHFGFREDDLMRAHVADGRQFVEQAKDRYDLVFLDGFGTDSVPAHLTTREFLTAVKNILTPRGIVVGNLWGRDANRLYDSMVLTYRDVYQEIRIVDVLGSGNKMLFASAQKTGLTDRQLVTRAYEVSRKFRLGEELVQLADQQMRPPGRDGQSGKLLTDAEAAGR